jgi:serine/threonine protein kinase
MAPEIHLKQPYEGKSVDIFAAGIILFIMVAQHPPFTTATPADPFYRCLAANRADIFWRTHCKNKDTGEAFFSEEFKHLIQSMLQLDPAQRPTILEIANHPWMKGEVPSAESVYQEFEERQQSVDAEIDASRQEKLAEKARAVQQFNKNYRNVKPEQIEMDNFPPLKELYVNNSEVKTTNFLSTYNPDMIENALKEHLQKINIEPKINNEKYKMQFSLTSKDQGDVTQVNEMQVKIAKVDDALVNV